MREERDLKCDRFTTKRLGPFLLTHEMKACCMLPKQTSNYGFLVPKASTRSPFTCPNKRENKTVHLKPNQSEWHRAFALVFPRTVLLLAAFQPRPRTRTLPSRCTTPVPDIRTGLKPVIWPLILFTRYSPGRLWPGSAHPVSVILK